MQLHNCAASSSFNITGNNNPRNNDNSTQLWANKLINSSTTDRNFANLSRTTFFQLKAQKLLRAFRFARANKRIHNGPVEEAELFGKKKKRLQEKLSHHTSVFG